jgi:SH3-like domain-containing protein
LPRVVSAPAPAPAARPVATPPAVSPPPPSAAPRAPVIAHIASHKANIRSGPSRSAKVVKTELRGKRLVVLERDGRWVRVGDPAAVGWVHASVLTAAP